MYLPYGFVRCDACGMLHRAASYRDALARHAQAAFAAQGKRGRRPKAERFCAGLDAFTAKELDRRYAPAGWREVKSGDTDGFRG